MEKPALGVLAAQSVTSGAIRTTILQPTIAFRLVSSVSQASVDTEADDNGQGVVPHSLLIPGRLRA